MSMARGRLVLRFAAIRTSAAGREDAFQHAERMGSAPPFEVFAFGKPWHILAVVGEDAGTLPDGTTNQTLLNGSYHLLTR
jgi:hypothetical protein